MFKLIAKILYVIALLAELIIAIRFILILVNAERNNVFANWIFNTSNILLQPFQGLVQQNITFWGLNIELTSLLAIFCLMVLGYVLTEMIKTFSQ
jgi:uncharacterized protein YggT (Ycf19 family)